MTPQPGEVWICTKKDYTNRFGSGSTIWFPNDRPFIVTCITRDEIRVVAASREPKGKRASFRRDEDWKWEEHMTRIWPPPDPQDDSWRSEEEADALIAAIGGEETESDRTKHPWEE